MCVPIAGLEDHELPDTPLGEMWRSIDTRLDSHVTAAELLFPGL